MNKNVSKLLQEIVTIRQSELERIKDNFAKGIVPQADLAEAEIALLNAKIELARETKQ